MLRFGVTGHTLDLSVPNTESAWPDQARAFEEAGFDALWAPDHIGLADPFTSLLAVACATERLRVGTYVLNVEFWNPLLLARAAATTDLLTGGRLIVGLGAGHTRAEFEQAGLRYPPAGERVDRLAAMVPALRQLLAGRTVDDERLGLTGAATGLPPVRPPLLVGGNGDRVMELAGREADIVGLTGFTSGPRLIHTDLSHWSWDGLADRLSRAHTFVDGDRRLAADVLVQRVAITEDPGAALADLIDMGLPAEHLDSPFLLVGDVDAILAKLQRMEDMGVASVTVFAHDAEMFADVIAHHRSTHPPAVEAR
jgi:probable F420-dependent oxidoreductase